MLEGRLIEMVDLSSGKAIDAHNALVDYAEFLRDVVGYPPEKVCEEIRRMAQEVVAQFAQKRE